MGITVNTSPQQITASVGETKIDVSVSGGIGPSGLDGGGYTLPTASNSVLGGVKIGTGVTITDGVISVSTDYAAASDFDQGVKTTDDVEFNTARLTNGDTQAYGFNKTQLKFEYFDGGGYSHWVSTTHNAGTAAGNRIQFHTNNGTAAGTFPLDAVLGLTIENGGIIVGSEGVTFHDNTKQTTAFTGAIDWSDVTGKPSDFSPSAHKSTHATGGSDALTASDIGAAAASHNHAWSDITSGVPSTFTPSSHNHAASEITSGTLDAARLPLATTGPAGAIIVGSGLSVSSGTLSAAVTSVAGRTGAVTIAAADVSGLATIATSGSASDLSTGTVGTARLGSGTANSTTFLRGDGTWAAAGSTNASDLTSGTLAYARMADPTVTSPSQIAANQNNYASFARGINRFTTNAARDITGMVAGNDGEVRVLCNVGTTAANTLTIKDESSSSTAANRFSVPWNGDCIIPAEGSVVVFYDGTSSRWRVI